jgi:hypothetical protein
LEFAPPATSSPAVPFALEVTDRLGTDGSAPTGPADALKQ